MLNGLVFDSLRGYKTRATGAGFLLHKKGPHFWRPLEYSGINLELFYIYSVQSFLSFL